MQGSVAILSIAASLALAGCGSTSDSATKPARSRGDASTQAVRKLALGTSISSVEKAFGRPAARYAQPVAKGSPLTCLVYSLDGRSTSFARLCFRDGTLAAMTTGADRSALRPGAVERGGHGTQLKRGAGGGGMGP